MKSSRFLILSDLHVPYHDIAYIALAKKLLKTMKFDGLVQLGDALDFWQVSRFDKDPSRKQTIGEDCLIYKGILEELADLLPTKGIIHQLAGNHETRLIRYIWQHAKELDGLVKTVPEMIGLRQLGVKAVWHDLDDWKSLKLGNCIIHHGIYYNAHVAMGNLTRYPFSFIQGHTHRFQYVSNGDRFSASLGHGSLEQYTAHQAAPTGWQQAMGDLTIINGKAYLTPILVHNGECVINGKKIEA